MRNPLVRLVGLTAAASLIVAPLVVAGPAQAAPDNKGTATINIVDDLGAPVKGLVTLVPVDDSMTAYAMDPPAPRRRRRSPSCSRRTRPPTSPSASTPSP